MKCIGILIHFPANISEIIQNLPAQEFKGPLSVQEKRDEVFHEIRSLLEERPHEAFIPTWQDYFTTLAQKVTDNSLHHESVLHQVVEAIGGPVQHTVEYPENAVLYESDLVPPVVVLGMTDINTVAERNAILALRAKQANILRLQGKVFI